ncbi:hypothetical protein Rhal01_01572 [Rubritalea halochordaticola]|uniref:Cytochrome c domain-containing protein n=1 Tax=Rubritalea halochordaticola TaxID=714537 RepID=A0ABP9V445_9BACT
MKRILKILASLLISLLSIIGLSTVTIGIFFDGAKDYMIGHIDRVSNEPPYVYDIDKIEAFLLMQSDGTQSLGTFQANAATEPLPYYGTTTIQGREAKEIASCWAATTKSFHARGLCFSPPYGIKMYSKGELKFQGAICWQCHRYKSDSVPFIGNTGFDGDSMPAQEMLKLLDQRLPYPKFENQSPSDTE